MSKKKAHTKTVKKLTNAFHYTQLSPSQRKNKQKDSNVLALLPNINIL